VSSPRPTVEEQVAALQDAAEQARRATRAAHEAIRDCRTARRELAQAVAEVRRGIATEFDTLARTVVEDGLAAYHETLERKVDEASRAVMERFDRLARLLTGETEEQRRRGGIRIEPAVRAVAARRQLGLPDVIRSPEV
jgi:hypothetical protein